MPPPPPDLPPEEPVPPEELDPPEVLDPPEELDPPVVPLTLKIAPTDSLPVGVTMQLGAAPLQAPDQPAKVLFAFAEADNVTGVPIAMGSLQVSVQPAPTVPHAVGHRHQGKWSLHRHMPSFRLEQELEKVQRRV